MLRDVRRCQEQTLEIQLLFKVGVVGDLHGDFLSGESIFLFELGVFEVNVVGDGSTRELDVVPGVGAVDAHDLPVGDGDRKATEQEQEDVAVEADGEEGDEANDEEGSAENEAGEHIVVEAAIAVDGERWVRDSLLGLTGDRLRVGYHGKGRGAGEDQTGGWRTESKRHVDFDIFGRVSVALLPIQISQKKTLWGYFFLPWS